MRGNRVVVSLVAILALLFGIYAIGAPVVEMSMFGHTESATFAELDGWSVATTIVRVLNVVAILMLLVPMFSQPNENGMCHVGVSLVAVLELVGAGFFVMMKEKAVRESGLQGLLDLLSVEYNVTSSFVQMVWSAVAVLVCGLILALTPKTDDEKVNLPENIACAIKNSVAKVANRILELRFLLRKDILGYQFANLCAIAVAFVLRKGLMDANLNGLLISVAVIASMGVVAGGIDFAVWKTIGNKT